MMTNPIINIEATIEADSTLVWDCYTQPAHITKWNFASDDWYCPSAENDLRIGGKYRVRMEAKDGSFGFDLEATYSEVEPGEKIIYVMADNRHVKVFMSPVGNSTQVVIEFEAENMNPLELQREGWQAILNNFKKYVESVTI
jgi:uncharacterized protein YndB with AHSA1/START domain